AGEEEDGVQVLSLQKLFEADVPSPRPELRGVGLGPPCIEVTRGDEVDRRIVESGEDVAERLTTAPHDGRTHAAVELVTVTQHRLGPHPRRPLAQKREEALCGPVP